jgi:hypothetical protein
MRLIIIAFKYGQENKRDLIGQIKALNIEKYNFPQLGNLVLLISFYLISILILDILLIIK